MGQLTFLNFIQDQRWHVAPSERADLTGKTVVVIGANAGLGFEAAKHFASMNPKRLVLGCRNRQKGQTALEGKCMIGASGLTSLKSSCQSHTSYGFQGCRRARTRRPLPIRVRFGICGCVRSRRFANRYPRVQCGGCDAHVLSYRRWLGRVVSPSVTS